MKLDELQRWFLEQVVTPHEAGPVAERADAPEVDTTEVIRPSRSLAPHERMDVYTRMYFVRLLEVLDEDYPVVHHLLGDAAFEKLIRGYLTKFPSRSYTLNDLGADLPGYLEGSVKVPRRALCRDVARVERAITEVFDGPDTPRLARDELPEIAQDVWPGVRFVPVESFQLFAVNHRANHVVTAVKQEKPMPPLGRKACWVAVYRKGHRVWRMDLTRPMYEALRALAIERQTVGDALVAAAGVWKGSPEQLAGQVFRWFDEWITEGFFQAVELP